jgi:hypothetical protein
MTYATRIESRNAGSVHFPRSPVQTNSRPLRLHEIVEQNRDLPTSQATIWTESVVVFLELKPSDFSLNSPVPLPSFRPFYEL